MHALFRVRARLTASSLSAALRTARCAPLSGVMYGVSALLVGVSPGVRTGVARVRAVGGALEGVCASSGDCTTSAATSSSSESDSRMRSMRARLSSSNRWRPEARRRALRRGARGERVSGHRTSSPVCRASIEARTVRGVMAGSHGGR